MKRPLRLLSRAGVILAFGCALTKAAAIDPVWWTTRGITVPGAEIQDYAILNQGQLKQFAYGTFLEWQSVPPNSPGSDVTALIGQWTTINSSGVRVPKVNAMTMDYAPVTLGQLKAVAKVFFDRMIDLGAANNYPWAQDYSSTQLNEQIDDYAVANIGQAKALFSFTLSGVDTWENPKEVGVRTGMSTTVSDNISSAMWNRYSAMSNMYPGLYPVTSGQWAGDYDSDGVSFNGELAAGTDPFSKEVPQSGNTSSLPPVIELYGPVGARLR